DASPKAERPTPKPFAIAADSVAPSLTSFSEGCRRRQLRRRPRAGIICRLLRRCCANGFPHRRNFGSARCGLHAAHRDGCGGKRSMNELLQSAVVAVALLLAPICCDSALAERRLALVVGNSAYQNVAVLPNPAKDAQAIEAKFKEVGFEVVSAHYD